MSGIRTQRIALWTGDGSHAANDILITENRERAEELAEYSQAGLLAMPAHLFYGVPTARPHLKVLSYYLQVARFPGAEVVDRDPELDAFFAAWRELCAAGHGVNKSDVTRVRNQVPQILQVVAPDTELVLDLIELANSILRTSICMETVHGDYVLASSKRRWWREVPARIGDLQKQVQRLRTLARGSSVFDPMITRAHDWLTAIGGLNSNNTELSLLSAAACCMAIGDLQRHWEQRMLALKFWYRGLDFFLQAKCLSHGLIVETTTGFIFPSDPRQLVGPNTCYSALFNAQVIVGSKPLADRLARCSGVRNQLLTVHSVFGVSEHQQKQFRDDVHGALREIDATKSVTVFKAANNLARVIPVDPAALFAFDRDVDLSLVEWRPT